MAATAEAELGMRTESLMRGWYHAGQKLRRVGGTGMESVSMPATASLGLRFADPEADVGGSQASRRGSIWRQLKLD